MFSFLRRAYRLAAREHHPDKNRGSEGAANERFKVIQHAYEVLSDTHERAWYDNHRSAILRGKDPAQCGDDDEACGEPTQVDILSYFSGACFAGFDDGDGGFYDVYGSVFVDLSTEEADEGGARLPKFGGAGAEWKEVSGFYKGVDGFVSKKAFAYADKWNLGEAPNRDTRRAMEKDNKRERVRAKKEFNTLVRELVAFVKKRDPRIKARKVLEEESRGEREKELEERKVKEKEERKSRAEDSKAQRDAVLAEDAEELDRILEQVRIDEKIAKRGGGGKKRRGRKMESSEEGEASGEEGNLRGDIDADGETDVGEVKVGDGNSEYIGEEDDGEVEELFCAACRKPFRTEGQMQNHMQSKKHIAAAKKLKKQLLKQDAKFGVTDASTAGHDFEGSTSLRTGEDFSDDGDDSFHSFSDEEAHFALSDGDVRVTEIISKKARRAANKKKRKNTQAVHGLGIVDDESEGGADDDDDSRGEEISKGPVDDRDEEAQAAHSVDVDVDGTGVTESGHSGGPAKLESDGSKVRSASKAKSAGPSKAERKQMRKKKGGASGAGPSASKNENELMCNVCSRVFTTRNKLFTHVKKESHTLKA